MKAILNASPIIAILDEIGDPGIFVDLQGLGWDLLVPRYVAHQEIRKPPGKEVLSELVRSGIVHEVAHPDEPTVTTFLAENVDLDRGESCVILSCVALKEISTPVTAVLDEGPARRKARDLEVEVIGTIGIINLLQERKIVSEERGIELKHALASSSFRAAPGLLAKKESRVT